MRAVVHVFVSFNGALNWWEPTSPVEILNTKELNVSSCLCLKNSQLSWKIVVPLIHLDPAFYLSLGPLMGVGVLCHLLILRFGNVACLYHLYMPMSHIKFKTMSHVTIFLCPCHLSVSLISPVIKKGPCCPLKFRGLNEFRESYTL